MTERINLAALEARLTRYKSVTDKVLFAYLPDHEPRTYLYDLVRSYPKRKGKGLRPALCLATCCAFGGTEELAVRSAAAIEIFHNGFLVHDDIEDGSLQRRGLPTLHVSHGLPIALNVGDAVFVLAIRPLMDNIAELGGVLAWLVFSEIEHMVRQSVEGQAIELGWIHENTLDLTPDDYLRMCLKKTCWYTTIHPCRIGALIGGKGHVPPAHFNQFAYFMGASFQITDDLLNLIGECSQYGKEPRGDLFEGKRTMALIHLFSSASKREKTWLGEFLSTPRAQRTNADVRHVYGLMERHGSIEFSRSRARFLAGAALAEYDKVFGDLPGSADKSFIRDIVHYMIERNI